MQALRDHAPERYIDELMARIAPTARRHINMRGMLSHHRAACCRTPDLCERPEEKLGTHEI